MRSVSLSRRPLRPLRDACERSERKHPVATPREGLHKQSCFPFVSFVKSREREPLAAANHGLAARATVRHPFMPLIVMPSMKYRWKRKKTITTGKVMRTLPAMISVQAMPASGVARSKAYKLRRRA